MEDIHTEHPRKTAELTTIARKNNTAEKPRNMNNWIEKKSKFRNSSKRKNKLIDCEDNKLYTRTKSFEDLDNSTDTSSFNIKSSCHGSPIMSTLNDLVEINSDKQINPVISEDKQDITRIRVKSKHTEYFCKASYKVGPSMKEMPSVDF